MQRFAFLLIAIFVSKPIWSQVQPTATGDVAPIDDDTRMAIPPLSGGMIYATVGTLAERTNYVTASVTTNASYIDNVLPASTVTPISDEMFSVYPALIMDRTTARQQISMTYDPSFTFYRNSSGLNAFDQTAAGSYQARLSPHITLALRDSFLRTSNVFNSQYPFAAGGLTGTTQTPLPAIIVPFAEQIRNNAYAALTYQFSRVGMVGGGATFTNYRFPNPSQAPGLYDSDETGVSAFYNRRLSRLQYAGLNYEWDDVKIHPTNGEVENQIQSILPFYMLVFGRKFSLSLAGGVQHVKVNQSQSSNTYQSWVPMGIASFGWQGARANLAGSYLRTTIAGQGLTASYQSDNANVLGGWQLSQTWNGSASISYQTISNIAFLPGLNTPEGNILTAAASLQHSFGEHVRVEVGYAHLNQQYKELAVIAANPNSNRVFVSVTYKLTKLLGR